MIRILDICDDVLFHVISFLTPLDFLLLSQTCSHFHTFVDATKHSPMNKFWKQRCEQCWKLIKENNYKSKDNKYTYDILFKSMIEFMLDVLKLSAAKPLSNNDLLQKNLRMQKQFGYNMQLTVDKVISMSSVKNTTILSMIMKQDKLDMFKIYTYNMSDKDINKRYPDFPVYESTYNGTLLYNNSLLFAAMEFRANKIAKFLLKFPNIDIHATDSPIHRNATHGVGDTPLLYASFYNQVEIVSLLINHPSMTKELMNQAGQFGAPLHCAAETDDDLTATTNIVDYIAARQDAAKIAQMLINDERTNINARDPFANASALMNAIIDEPYVAHILVDDDRFDVNVQCDMGQTALHYAAQMSQYDAFLKKEAVAVVKKILQRKDFNSINVKDEDGKTALDVAKDWDFKEMIDLLTSSQQN